MKKRAFTVAEVTIVLMIVTVIVALVAVSLNKVFFGSKQIVTSYQKTYADLESIAQLIKVDNTDRSPISGVVSSGGFDYLSCSTPMDKTQCLKEIILKKTRAQGCSGDCMTNFSGETLPALRTLDNVVAPNFTNFEMLKLPSGAVVAMKYLDASCGLKMPIYKKGNDLQIVSNSCGIMVVDVNGDKKPNHYSSDGVNSDVFLFAIKKDAIVGSPSAISGTAGCKFGETVDFANGGCIRGVTCPQGSETSSQGVSGAYRYKDMWGKYGWCVMKKGCPQGTEVFNGACVVPCAADEERDISGVCVKKCAADETRINGVCSPTACANEANQIKTQADLWALNGKSGTYCLMNDITFDVNGPGSAGSVSSRRGWIPLGGFSGKFYGNNHKLIDFFSTVTNTGYGEGQGIFGRANISLIDGVGLVYTPGKDFTDYGVPRYSINTNYVGGLIGYNGVDLIISNCYNLGAIQSQYNYVGGLLGYSLGTLSIINSYNVGAITGNEYVGGLTGFLSGLISNSINVGSVFGEAIIGGLAGETYVGSITNSINTGAITGNQGETGGLTGLMEDGKIFNSTNMGVIKSLHSSHTGGLVGYIKSNSSSSISNCNNKGKVNSYTTYTGGLVGYIQSGSISNSLNDLTGVIGISSEGEYIGGLAGYMNSGSISNFLNTGFSTGYRYVGGVVGYIGSSFITNSYCVLRPCTPSGTPAGCSSLTSAQSKTASTYSSLDKNIWNIKDGVPPTLKDSIMPPQNGQLGSWNPTIWVWNAAKGRPTLIANPEP